MKEYVSWGDVECFIEDVEQVCNMSGFQFDGIYGISRGGVVLASMLSHRMHIPLLLAPTDKSLIVVDVCDSGEYLIHYAKDSNGESQNIQKLVVVTMYYKENELGVQPNYYLNEKGDNCIVFPWENKED